MKVPFKPGTLIYPLPAVMVTCGDCEENYNIITVGWTGTICSDPPMCYISVCKERHSYVIILKNKEFVINLTTEDLVQAYINRYHLIAEGDKIILALSGGIDSMVLADLLQKAKVEFIAAYCNF